MRMALRPINSRVSSSVFCSTSNHDSFESPCAKTIWTMASSLRLNNGERKALASDRSCCGDTNASSSATMSSTSQQSISSVFSPIWAGMCSARSSSCSGIRPARLRDSTMTLEGLKPAANCSAIHAAAWRASKLRKVSSGNSRGVVKLSRQPVVSGKSSLLASRDDSREDSR